jgi:hypothetical protein
MLVVANGCFKGSRFVVVGLGVGVGVAVGVGVDVAERVVNVKSPDAI